MGWTLKTSQSRHTKFTENQKQYLNAKFQTEERTGKKADPTEVSKAVRTAKDNNGERLFSYGDFLTSQQISTYFSRLAAKRSVEADQHDSEDEASEEDLQSVLSDKVLSEVSIQHSHPIIYDSYNICELVLNSKLGSLSVSVLRDICESFGLDISGITVTRKSHLWPCSQTWFKVVAVASAHNCIPLRHMLLLPGSLNLSYLATKTILVLYWHQKHRII